ncbi:winged helix-turn-helix domain-containing protein [Luteimonas kalidii]|uniref:Winged helix-turn-helix domain-containing protein n=1 Tax=Luteimonas kalidii TaxID=3042025 RepID=A0ABT6JS17_9GAMM|nr:LpqB family beta-propeller domain-containing protein [Luteimonas kalidii]MDH5833480.1 winged helix-turn-helix domain-containing protein [Luteimonas kalidii]
MSEHIAIGKIGLPGDRAAPGASPNFSAGEALVQPSLNRISLHGHVHQVEPKVMQVLVLMATRPGTVIAREAFLDTVWAGTVGDDYLLNRAVSELRKVFGDDPQSPRYIETIRKGGYRLIAPIAPARVAAAIASPSPQHGAGVTEAAHAVPAADAAAPGDRPTDAGTPRLPGAGRSPLRLAGGVAALVLAAIAAVAAWSLRAPPAPTAGAVPPSPANLEIHPLTSLVGRELEPALSPDGSRVAFIWDAGGTFDVYVKAIGSEALINLSDSPLDERHPTWMPDGRSLLFARSDAEGVAILRVSASGGGVTLALRDPAMRDLRGMSVSPDGSRIAYAARAAAGDPYRLHLAGLDGTRREVLSRPAAGSLGDIDPRFSPDGRSIVFARGLNEVTKDLYRVPVDGGAPTRMTFDNRKINGLAWSATGDRILFTSTRSGLYALWSLDPDGGTPVQVPLGNEDVHQPATAPGVEAIMFEQWRHRSHLRQVDVASGRDVAEGGLLQSTRWDSNPAWSPDGQRIAFASNRGGPHGIWVSRRDGSGAVEVAAFEGTFVDNPAWSPDGRRIAFDASPEGRTAIFVVGAEGGTARPLVTGPGDHRNPAWSRDGAWLYFESNRDGGWRAYAQAVDGGAAVAVSPGPAVHPRESRDGRLLLYAKPDAPGLWQVARADWSVAAPSTTETLLVEAVQARDGGNWAPSDAGIYHVRRPPDGAPALALFDVQAGTSTDLLTLSPDFEGWGLDLSPDQTRLLFSEMTLRESDLRLAQPRR